MQKVVGSNPIIRFKTPANGGFSFRARRVKCKRVPSVSRKRLAGAGRASTHGGASHHCFGRRLRRSCQRRLPDSIGRHTSPEARACSSRRLASADGHRACVPRRLGVALLAGDEHCLNDTLPRLPRMPTALDGRSDARDRHRDQDHSGAGAPDPRRPHMRMASAHHPPQGPSRVRGPAQADRRGSAFISARRALACVRSSSSSSSAAPFRRIAS